MALEAGDGYISGLVSTNPVGATDPKSQGDDHIRLIKVALKGTFPNLSGAVTASQAELNLLDGVTATTAELNLLDGVTATTAELNYLSGVTSAIQTQLNAKLASASYTAADVLSKLLTVDGAGSGLDADLLDGFSSAAFAQLASANTFTGSTAGGRIHQFINTNTGSTSYADILASNGTRSARLTMLSTGYSGAFFGAGPSGEHATLWTDGNIPFVFGTASEARFWIDGSGNFNFKSGTVTTSNASAAEVGKTGAPSRTISDTANTAASDQGGTVRMTGGSGKTFTLDSDVPADCVVVLDNASGNSWTIAASGTLTWATTGGTGSRTLANGGLAVALSLGSGNYKITGGGLS